MPECLARFDWREWRPPALPDDPFPEYSEWMLAQRDFDEARDAWRAGRPVLLPPERPLPDPVPYTGMRPIASGWKPPHPDVVAKIPAHHQSQPPYPHN